MGGNSAFSCPNKFGWALTLYYLSRGGEKLGPVREWLAWMMAYIIWGELYLGEYRYGWGNASHINFHMENFFVEVKP